MVEGDPGRSRGVGWLGGDKRRGSTDPCLEVDEDEGPSSGLSRWSSPVEGTSRFLEAFRAARLSTRRLKSGDESARV